eukprot:COSAG01_NODE_545_length_15679_cov_68.030167_7_plen_39_part_00
MMALFSMAAWRCLRFSVAAQAVLKQINCVWGALGPRDL